MAAVVPYRGVTVLTTGVPRVGLTDGGPSSPPTVPPPGVTVGGVGGAVGTVGMQIIEGAIIMQARKMPNMKKIT